MPDGDQQITMPGTTPKLTAALAKAQESIKGAVKGKANPHFKSKYADLAALWDAVREPLTKNGLAVIHATRVTEGGVVLRSTLLHTSGEERFTELPLMTARPGMQDLMAALTYGKRGNLGSLTGVVAEDEDDDGNTAAGHTPGATKDTSPPAQVKAKSVLPAEPPANVKAAVTKWIDTQIEAVSECASMDSLLAWENETSKEGETNLAKMDRILGSVWPQAGNRLKGAYLLRQAELNPANGD